MSHNADQLTMLEFHELVANALSWADRQGDLIGAFVEASEQLPPEIQEALKSRISNEANLIAAFIHLTMAAIDGGILSRDTMLESVTREYGLKGARRLERIIKDHEECWAAIKSTVAPIAEWTPPAAPKGD